MTLTVQGLYAEFRGLYGSVPTYADGACEVCLGRKNAAYPTCIPCDRNGFERRIGRGPSSVFFPLSTALLHGSEPPASWYRALREYKRTGAGFQEHWTKVAASLGMGLHGNEERFASALGGPIDAYTIVPSSTIRDEVELPSQELYYAVWCMKFLRAKLRLLLVATMDKAREQVRPQAFRCLRPQEVVGRRIVLIDDSWVTGGSALSARECLLDAGAAGVAIVVAARVVNPDFARVEDVDPYHVAMLRPHDPTRWPR